MDEATNSSAAHATAGPQAHSTTCRFFDSIALHAYPGCMSHIASEAADKRQHLRFDKVFPVRFESILFGELACIARNVSAGGIFLETRDPLPLGARVRVAFLNPEETAEIVAVGEVKNHYFMNYVQHGITRSVS